jgi:hypothetical protein
MSSSAYATFPAGEPEGWPTWAEGFIALASILLVLAGSLQFLTGLAVVFDDGFVTQPRHYAFKMEPSAWGWLHMGFGVVMMLSGLGLFSGNLIARAVACTVATLSALSNFIFLPDYPLWATTVIALDIAILWAVLAHMEPRRALPEPA